MNDKLKQYAQRFNAQSIRERGLIAASLLVVISYSFHGSVWQYLEPSGPAYFLIQYRNFTTDVVLIESTSRKHVFFVQWIREPRAMMLGCVTVGF